MVVEVKHLVRVEGSSYARITGGRKHHRLALWLMILFVCAVALALLASPARAAELVVTNTKDSGAGSLRDAIKIANTNDQSDTITFRVPDNSTITLTSGQLTIANEAGVSPDLTIKGPGARKLAVSGNNSSRVFRIDKGTEAGIEGLTIKKGFTKRDGSGVSGYGGGIYNGGTLTLANSTVANNSAREGSGGRGIGYGVFNDGTLKIINSTISNNSSDDSLCQTIGCTFGGGGGIYNDGTLKVANSTVSGNSTSGFGAGIANDRGALELNNSTISNNSALVLGGGIYNNDTLTINDSTISNNSTSENGNGGGIYNSDTTPLVITNSTISGNNANHGGGINNRGILTTNNSTVSDNSAIVGGGIYSITDSLTTTPNPLERTTIKNSTISGNRATSTGGGIDNFVGLTIIENSTITKNTAPKDRGGGVGSYGSDDTRTEVRASIISANTNTDVDIAFGSTTVNTFESKGSNLIGDGNATGAFNKTGDQRRVSDPGLGTLARNGGPTKTHGLVKGSPAIDAVELPAGTVGATAVEEPCEVAEDQRGVTRPQDGNEDGTAKCDIGSFELKAGEVITSPPPPPSDPPPSDPPPSDPPPTTNPPKNPNACTIKGNNKDNVLSGTPKRDVICGFGGNDIIRGLGGNDLIKGGAGNDIIYGQGGNDRLLGGNGNDVLYGVAGQDRLLGERGNDALFGGVGRDVLLGGPGKNVLIGGAGKDVERGGITPSTAGKQAKKLVNNIFSQVGL